MSSNPLNILVLTDIHEHLEAAEAAYHTVKPNAVLDCGDHESLRNLFDVTPHLYVLGNHEPKEILLDVSNGPLPTPLNAGQIVTLSNGHNQLRVSGIGGNYSGKNLDRRDHGAVVSHESLEALASIPPKKVDVLLLHESPFNALEVGDFRQLAAAVVEQIERIQPSYVFTGHVGKYSLIQTPKNKVNVVGLTDMVDGYLTLTVDDGDISINRIKAVYGSKR